MPNPIIAQRHLAALKAAQAAKNNATVKAATVSTPGAPPPPPKAKAPADRREALETLPDSDLQARLKVLEGLNYDPDMDRDGMLDRLIELGVDL